eukprot:CAMPEP_0170464940 /NCGR_PEP_ID=MMETSP0123-20130129/9468_1 /TAXON_ID=182087 /ORGANISM="Favella ehrenbergii, Strain Fehren 1" /LENGTH=182 /DNA_ID=CAMNT_0010730707 /DNA_START=31 /DNA_END=579 /DNA_ORIENTATION=+
MRLTLFSTSIVAAVLFGHTTDALKIKNELESEAKQDQTELTQTGTGALTNLEAMTEAEAEAMITSMIETYASSQVQAAGLVPPEHQEFLLQVHPASDLRSDRLGGSERTEPVGDFLHSGLAPLLPRHLHVPLLDAVAILLAAPPQPAPAAAPAAAQVGSEDGGTWLDAVREQGIELSQEEAI